MFDLSFEIVFHALIVIDVLAVGQRERVIIVIESVGAYIAIEF